MQFTFNNSTDIEKVSTEMRDEVLTAIKNGLEQLKDKNKDKYSFNVSLDVIINIRDTKLEDQ